MTSSRTGSVSRLEAFAPLLDLLVVPASVLDGWALDRGQPPARLRLLEAVVTAKRLGLLPPTPFRGPD